MAEGIKFRSVNQGFIRGTLTKMETMRKFSKLTVKTSGSGVKAEIMIRVFDTSMLEGIKPGKRIDIECHIETKRITVKTDSGSSEKDYTEQYVVADNISLPKRALFYYAPEFSIEDDYNGGYPNDANAFKVAGRVRSVLYSNDEMCILSIGILENGLKHSVNASCFHRQKKAAESFPKGTPVIVTGSVTNGKEKPDEIKSEMFYCKDIAEVISV